ncbi:MULTISPECIES: hypothetical protein [Clostridium]|uniref:hypothetical protein n=1 Tax=Clostridium TaxID=1485 RepID=UPI000826D3B5|nr:MULTISPECIES: hypothetical protein [Clostridium]PJI07952.1 hypothetical protein CUB90_08755 [Clostridium sp. CT7]
MQVDIIKIIVGIFGIIASIVFLYFSIMYSPETKEKIKISDTNGIAQKFEVANSDDTAVILDDVCDTSVLGENKNKDDTVYL